MLPKNLTLLSAASVLVQISACTKPETSTTAAPSESELITTLAARAAAVPVSNIAGSGCDQPVETLAVCDWAASVDGVIFGTIQAAVPIASPALADGTGLVEECEGTENTGIRFDLVDVEWLYSSGPTTLSVHVGATQAGSWKPLPAPSATGGLDWLGAEEGHEPMAINTRIGMAVTKVPGTETWSLMGEEPFTYNDEKQIIGIARPEVCIFIGPSGVEGSSIESFRGALAGCDPENVSTEGALHRQRRAEMPGADPAWTHTAVCIGSTVTDDTLPPK